MEINVKISCPDLTLAAATIAKALMGRDLKIVEEHLATLQPVAVPATEAAACVAQASMAPTAAPVAAPVVAPTQAPVTPQAAVVSAPGPAPVAHTAAPVAAQAPVTAPPSNPAPAAATAAPTSPAPQITLDQIGKAGADLMGKNPAIMPQLSALLQKYGVQTVQQLKAEQTGAFALELRGLGANI